jgi:hypothetical protein
VQRFCLFILFYEVSLRCSAFLCRFHAVMRSQKSICVLAVALPRLPTPQPANAALTLHVFLSYYHSLSFWLDCAATMWKWGPDESRA